MSVSLYHNGYLQTDLLIKLWLWLLTLQVGVLSGWGLEEPGKDRHRYMACAPLHRTVEALTVQISTYGFRYIWKSRKRRMYVKRSTGSIKAEGESGQVCYHCSAKPGQEVCPKTKTSSHPRRGKSQPRTVQQHSEERCYRLRKISRRDLRICGAHSTSP